jgi:Zn-dependent peptidase ImmA (M78 family)
MDWQQQQRLAKRAAFEAEKVRLAAKIPHTAPIDPIETARARGCEVRFMSLPSLEGMYSPAPKPLIILGSERWAGRRTFTCAHELAHHVFKHGVMLDQLNEQKNCGEKTQEEFLADAFAGHLLMSKSVVGQAIKARDFTISSLTPEQVYQLSCYFGVGYGTAISHMTYALKMITRLQADALLKVKPKEIKARYGASASTELVIADFQWRHRSLDAEIGDTIVLPEKALIEPGSRLQLIEKREGAAIYRVLSAGYSRAYCDGENWAVHVRISRKNYAGLAQYRFFEEMEEDE